MSTCTVVIVRERCMGVSMCTQHAPGAFELDDDGIAVLVTGHTATDEQLLEAAYNCPMSAIEFFRDGARVK